MGSLVPLKLKVQAAIWGRQFIHPNILKGPVGPQPPPGPVVYTLNAGTSGGSWRGYKLATFGAMAPTAYGSVEWIDTESNVGSFLYQIIMTGFLPQDFWSTIDYGNGVIIASVDATTYNPGNDQTVWDVPTAGPAMVDGVEYTVTVTP